MKKNLVHFLLAAVALILGLNIITAPAGANAQQQPSAQSASHLLPKGQNGESRQYVGSDLVTLGKQQPAAHGTATATTNPTSCNAARDIIATVLNWTTFSIRFSVQDSTPANCTYRVGTATYEFHDDGWQHLVSENHGDVSLNHPVELSEGSGWPSCGGQKDAFRGGPIEWLHLGSPPYIEYGNRHYYDDSQGSGSCGPGPTPSPSPSVQPSGTPIPPSNTPEATNTPIAPTATPTPRVALNLVVSSVECAGPGQIHVHFILNHLPDVVLDYGHVDFVMNGQSYIATFTRRTGDAAHYDATVTGGSGHYVVESGEVTITTPQGQETASLDHPFPFDVENCDLTPSPTPTSVVPTITPTNTPVVENTPTATPTVTNTPAATNTPGGPTDTPSPTPTMTATVQVPTATATATPNGPTATATVTSSPVPSNTPGGPTDTPSPTPTMTATVSQTPTAGPTNTPSATPTNTPTNTATSTATATRTSTNTPTRTPVPQRTRTPRPVPTNTPVPPTNTPMPVTTSTSVPVSTATATPINTLVPTNTPPSSSTGTTVPSPSTSPVVPPPTNTPIIVIPTDTPVPTTGTGTVTVPTDTPVVPPPTVTIPGGHTPTVTIPGGGKTPTTTIPGGGTGTTITPTPETTPTKPLPRTGSNGTNNMALYLLMLAGATLLLLGLVLAYASRRLNVAPVRVDTNR